MGKTIYDSLAPSKGGVICASAPRLHMGWTPHN